MKKLFTRLLLTLFVAMASNSLIAQKNVLYLIQDGTNSSDYANNGGSMPGEDRVVKMLEADANFNIGWIKIESSITSGTAPNVTALGSANTGSNAVGSPATFDGFDLVIVSETLTSSNAIFTAGKILHPDQLTIPVIYTKAWAFRNGKLLTSAAAAVVRTQELAMSVEDASSPLFSGIDVSSGSVTLFRTTSDDKGNVGAYSIDVVENIEITSTSSTLVASVPYITGATASTSLALNYLPSGTQLGTTADGILAQNAVAMPFSYGALVKKDGGNITSEFLTIWRNAAYMLTGQTVPTTLYANAEYDKYELITSTTTYDFRDGSIIPNHTDRYTLQGSTEALAAPQTDRFKSADGFLDYRHSASDNYHSSGYGLDMKAGASVRVKAANGTSKIRVPLSEYSSLDFRIEVPNTNNKAWLKVNGTTIAGAAKITFKDTITSAATTGNDLAEFIEVDYYGMPAAQDIQFHAQTTSAGAGSDIYLPYVEVVHTTLRKIPTKILYVNQIGVGPEVDSGASAAGADPVISMLEADENLEVTYVETAQDGSSIDLTGYDLVIAQETISSGAALFKPGSVLGLKDVSIPVIYNKSWAFRNGKAITDADASVSGTQNVSVTVPTANQNNPLFSGIDFTDGDEIRLFKSATAKDNGSVGGNKAIDVGLNINFSSAAAGSLATVPEITDAATSILINHIPAGTQVGEAATDVTTADHITFGFSYGAMAMGDGANVSPELLTIWRNAVYVLAGETPPTTLVANADFWLPKKVLYVNQIGVGPEVDSGASAAGADPVISMLQADEKFDVTYVETAQDGSSVDLTGYDLVIAQETISSGAALFKPGGVLGLKDVTVPVIYNKSWAFRNGKAITDADASVSGTQNVSVTVTNTAHPLYKGIDFTGGDEIRLFKSATAKDNGSVGGNKAIDVGLNINLSSAAAGSLATVPEITDAATSMLINYLPSGTQVGEAATDVLGVNAVAFGFSYGAMAMGDGANVSPELLTIWRNAAYMLTWGPSEVPTTLVENPKFLLPKNVLYVNQTGVGPELGSGASEAGADPVISMLIADENINITYVETAQDGSSIDLTGIDLVIAQETISSGAALFKPGNVLGLKDVTVPVIYNKSWAFRNGKAITDADASVSGTQNVSVTVPTANQSHALFNGIDFSGGDDVRLFKDATAKDNGSVGGNKAIDVGLNIDFAPGSAGTLATVPEITDAATSMLINHIPSGTQVGEATTDVIGVDAVAFGFSYGAMAMGDGANVSPELLTIWRNAVYLLLYGSDSVPTSLVENAAFVLGVDTFENADRSPILRAYGGNVSVSNIHSETAINIYNLTGALIKSVSAKEDVEFQLNSGLYIATMKNAEGTKAVKFYMN